MSQAEITSYETVKGGHVPADASNIIVGTDDDGNVVPPHSIANFQQIGGLPYNKLGWAVPVGVEEDEKGDIPIRQPIFKRVYVDGITDYEIKVAETTNVRARHASDSEVIAETETEKVGVDKAIDWILNHPVISDVSIPQRDLLSEAPLDDLHERFNRIREGTRVTIPNYEGTFEALHELGVPYWDDAFLLEHSSGTLFRILKQNSSLDYSRIYLQPLDGFATEISDFTALNEHNLRDDVHTETYDLIKDNVGEKMAHFHTEDAHIFETIEIDSVNDGFVNPGSDAPLDPEKHHPSGIYIDESEAGQWVALNGSVEPHLEDDTKYILTEDGVYEKSDHYALEQKVPGELWYGQDGAPDPDETHSIDDFELANPIEWVEKAPDYDDSLTTFPYIGEKRAESIHAANVGEAVDRGFPFFDVPWNGKMKIMDMIHKMDLDQRFGTTVKQVTMGLLGAIGHDITGEKVGSLASLLVEDVSMHEIEWAWLAPGHGLRRKYSVEFGDTPNYRGFAFAVGTPERGHTIDYLKDEGTVKGTPVTAIRTPIRSDQYDTVALGTPTHSRWIDIPERILEYVSHLFQTDYSDIDTLEEHAMIRVVEKEKKTLKILEFQHPTTNAVAIVTPDRTRDTIAIEDWKPW